MQRPVVLIIENPDGDPSVHTVGDVEVISVSTYPASGYDTEPDEYSEYPAEMRALAARLEALGNTAAAAELVDAAVTYERRWGAR